MRWLIWLNGVAVRDPVHVNVKMADMWSLEEAVHYLNSQKIPHPTLDVLIKNDVTGSMLLSDSLDGDMLEDMGLKPFQRDQLLVVLRKLKEHNFSY